MFRLLQKKSMDIQDLDIQRMQKSEGTICPLKTILPLQMRQALLH